ncbi:MAG TPA: hypothetical protein PKA38_03275 [Candidatus Levybacteria bacterium]|nr:hypothetical protein [Candidatus Levybacteria bacterium]
MQEKNIGYSLLGVGVITMFIAVGVVILTFTGNMTPVSVFNIAAPTIDTSAFVPKLLGGGQKIEIIPTTAFNKLLNLSVEFLLMTFVLSFGFKLADLGVKLVRSVRTHGKE